MTVRPFRAVRASTAAVGGMITFSVLAGQQVAVALPSQSAQTSTYSLAQASSRPMIDITDCTYRVKAKSGVYEWPSDAWRLHGTRNFLGYKKRGKKVRGFSALTYFNTTEHRWYRAVKTAKARDGIGWMRKSRLKRLHCDR